MKILLAFKDHTHTNYIYSTSFHNFWLIWQNATCSSRWSSLTRVASQLINNNMSYDERLQYAMSYVQVSHQWKWSGHSVVVEPDGRSWVAEGSWSPILAWEKRMRVLCIAWLVRPYTSWRRTDRDVEEWNWLLSATPICVTLNMFLGMGQPAWKEAHATLQNILSSFFSYATIGLQFFIKLTVLW